NKLVRPALIFKRRVQALPIDIERVGILHRELADAEEAGLGARFIAKFRLNLIPDLRQLFVRSQLTSRNISEDLFVGHTKAIISPLAVLEAKHGLAHDCPATTLLPEFGRMEGWKIDLLTADGIHLLADYPGDLEKRPLRKRQSRVDAGR